MRYYKGYWMVTNRCNLRCNYCVLEDAPHQLKAELDLENKKQLIWHLYHKLKFRRLTLSGGEVVIFGKYPPSEFIELLKFIKQFKSSNPKENLEIELYSNGTYINEKVISEMQGVVDMVAVTIDSKDNNFLSDIGRNFGRYKDYFKNISHVCRLVKQVGIKLKLHSVVGQRNHLNLPNEVAEIYRSIGKPSLSSWKFYQYMSYDAAEKDNFHAIDKELYGGFVQRTKNALSDFKINLHFKDNEEMNASLFNILSYGNAQYMRDNDTWTTSQRTEDLRSYESMDELFAKHDIDAKRFQKFHEL